jgi:hypothetical protein
MYTSPPTYRYIIVSDKEEKIQYDWKLYFQESIILTCYPKELKLESWMIGRKVGEVIQDKQFFAKPK